MTTMMSPNPPYKRGDVVLVLFPNSDLQTAKRRPALVVQSVMTDNLATILDSEIDCVIGSLPMTEVDKALRHTLGI